MKKIIFILIATIMLFSCKKEEDITDKDYTVTAKVRVWDTNTLTANENIQGAKFQFYNSSSDLVPFSTLYTGANGECTIVLKGDTEYYTVCSYGGYKDKAYTFHSTTKKTSGWEGSIVSIVFVKQ